MQRASDTLSCLRNDSAEISPIEDKSLIAVIEVNSKTKDEVALRRVCFEESVYIIEDNKDLQTAENAVTFEKKEKRMQVALVNTPPPSWRTSNPYLQLAKTTSYPSCTSP